jgi:putative transposase
MERPVLRQSGVGKKGGFLPRMPDSLEQLDLLLLTATARKVHPDGIRFQGLRYIDTTLAANIGESVMLRYDPRDAAEVRVFFYNDRFLCRAICPDLAGAVITLRDVLKARKTTPTRAVCQTSGTLKSHRPTLGD